MLARGSAGRGGRQGQGRLNPHGAFGQKRSRSFRVLVVDGQAVAAPQETQAKRATQNTAADQTKACRPGGQLLIGPDSQPPVVELSITQRTARASIANRTAPAFERTYRQRG